MPYKLQPDEPLVSGLTRIAGEQLEIIIGHLHQGKVYEARKGIKRMRALLHLLEPELGPLALEENHRLRNTARKFGSLRDADVSLEVLEEFTRHYKRQTTLDPQRKALKEKQTYLQRQTDWKTDTQEALDVLGGTRKRIDDWRLLSLTLQSLNSQLDKTHKQGRRALKRVMKTRTAEDFHELRKSVKRELNQRKILEGDAAQSDELKQLATLLGDHHNLVVLTANLENSSGRFRLLVRRQERLFEARILPAASQVYQVPLI